MAMSIIRNITEIFSAYSPLPSRKNERHEILLEDTIPLENPTHIIILGATLATAFNAQSAYNTYQNQDDISFVAVGGKSVKKIPFLYKTLLTPKIKKANLEPPNLANMTEAEYARQILRDLKVPEKNIKLVQNDTSRHTQANIAVLKELGLDNSENRLQFFTLAGNGYRVLGTALANFENNPVISVTNVFPYGVTRENRRKNLTTAGYIGLEAAKSLPHPKTGKEAIYVTKGFMTTPNFEKINNSIRTSNNQTLAL